MASDRQVEANRRNSARSTGPRTEAGKARSRANSTRHGMAGGSASVEAGLSAEFESRRARWAAVHSPAGEAGGWALDRAVAASLRIERCERALEGLTVATGERARLAWDQDRAVEAATVAGRLARDPALASRQLEATWAGVGLLLDLWLGLVEGLEAREGWSESEAARALDLLGVPAELRSGGTPIDGPEGSDPVAFRRELALGEVDRLVELRDGPLATLEEMERRHAMAGDLALLSRPARLILRYERDAWRRYRESIREVRESAASTGVAGPIRAVEPAPAPPVPARAHPFEAERRALREAVAPLRAGFVERFGPVDLDDEDGWLDDLERRVDERYRAPEIPGTFVPIAAGAPTSGG